MAILTNHPITGTVYLSLNYCSSDKIAERKSDSEMEGLFYEELESLPQAGDAGAEGSFVVYKTYTTTLNLDKARPGDAYQTFKRLMDKYGRDEIKNGNAKTKDGKPIIAWHFIQSFEGKVDAITANEIGVKMSEKFFNGRPCQISTHTDKENTHNHFIVCAWDLSGTKWNQCNRVYREMRRESDRLCEEYGLSVLEGTREQKLVKYKDAEGREHYYEPTDRKNRMIREREKGNISTDDVGSYRNTKAYEKAQEKTQTVTQKVKGDIDRMLPYATSYEHLLSLLRQSGYKIKDKKKNGDWLEHITFTPPDAEPGSRGKRDNSLSGDGYYLRQNLEKVIAENMRKRRQENVQDKPIQNAVPMGEYEYGETDLSRFDENYRTERQSGGGERIYPRGEVERDVVRDTKRMDSELRRGLIDTSDLDRAIREMRNERKTGKRTPGKNRQEVLVRQIQENLDNLSFIERNKIYSYGQVSAVISDLWDRHNKCSMSLDEVRRSVNNIELLMTFPQRREIIVERMNKNAGNPEYMRSEYGKDVQALKTLDSNITRYHLDTPEGLEAMGRNYKNSTGRLSELTEQLAAVRETLTEYQNCMEVLRRIDRESGGLYGHSFQEQRGQEKTTKTEQQSEQKQERRKTNERE